MKLSELISVLNFYQLVKPIDDIEVSGLEMDSRKVESGNVFVCINGYTVDGHDYAQQAEANGAIAIIAEKPIAVSIPIIIVNDTVKALSMLSNKYYHFPTNQLRLIGVTGTNGKTTVTYLLEDIFQKANQKTGLIGTIQMKMGNESVDVNNTTPDALFLQKSFHQMVQKDLDTVMMEVSSHALDMGRVYGCDYDIAIFTNLSQDHLDYHHNMNDYFHAKSLLFSQLGSRYNQRNPKFAVINQDDSYSSALIKSTSQPVVTYGIDTKADVKAEDVYLSANGSQFMIHSPQGCIQINSKLMGKFSVYNMLAAAASAICANIPLSTIKEALEETTGVNGRFQPVLTGQSFGVIVDYAHTPDSLENVLTTIQSFAKAKVYVVVGCGGDRDKGKRPLMAEIAVNNADLAIFTSDNPRSEDPNQIITDMITNLEHSNYQTIVNRKDAISYAIELANQDDIILIAGKGHETYQIIGDQVFSFDDRQVATDAILTKMGKEK